MKPSLASLGVGSGPYAYTQLVRSVFGASLIEHWTGDDQSGTVSLAEVNTARNGLYTAVTMAQPGIGDGRTSALYSGAASSRNNVYTANFASAFNGPVGTLLAWAKCTNWTDGTQRYTVYWQADGNNKVYLSKASTNNVIAGNYVAGGANISFSLTSFSPSDWFPIVMTWDKTTTNTAYFYINGQRITVLGSLGTWAGTFTSTVTCIGALTSTGTAAFNGNIAHVAVGNTALPSPDVALLSRIPGHCTAEGDSRAVSTTWPSLLRPNIPGFGWNSVAVGGATLADMQSRAAANIAAYKRLGLTKNVMCILGGLNDVLNGANLATIQSRFTTLYTTIRDGGMIPVPITELDAQSAAANLAGWHSTIRPAYNAWMLSTFPNVADAGGLPHASNALDTTYFNVDFVHPKTALDTEIASTVATRVMTL